MSRSREKASAIRRRWSREEDDMLTQAVRPFQSEPSIDWRQVAQSVPDRNNKDCRKRWLKIDARWRQGQWIPPEDEALLKAVAQYSGPVYPWKAISDRVKTRNPDQCAKRWKNALNPELIRSDWTEEDDERLLRAIREVGGTDWKRIVEDYFPGRARLELSNKYTRLIRKRRPSHEHSSAAGPSTAADPSDDSEEEDEEDEEDEESSTASPLSPTASRSATTPLTTDRPVSWTAINTSTPQQPVIANYGASTHSTATHSTATISTQTFLTTSASAMEQQHQHQHFNYSGDATHVDQATWYRQNPHAVQDTGTAALYVPAAPGVAGVAANAAFYAAWPDGTWPEGGIDGGGGYGGATTSAP